MNLEPRMTQGLDMSQQLNLAPQLLQWLRLLQLPSTELCAMVQQELEVNPTLELEESIHEDGDEPDSFDEIEAAPVEALDPEMANFDEQAQDMGEKFDLLAEMDSDWSRDTEYSQPVRSTDSDEKRQYMMDCITAPQSLQNYLFDQLSIAGLTAEEREFGGQIIGSLDSRGYLTLALEELAADAGVTLPLAERVLSQVQLFDPAGVGARDLQECLLLQIKDKTSLTANIIRNYMDALARRQYREIALELAVTEEDVMGALKEIKSLNPDPGSLCTKDRVQYVKPDVTIRKVEGEYVVEMNEEHLPRLRISSSCRKLLEVAKISTHDAAYIRKKIRTSSFLIQGIKQRQDTLRKVALEIVRHQKDYFNSEDGIMKPLTMARVAQLLNVHETTISRALANKYIETPRGLFEMKHFFGSGYTCEDGSSLIPSAVKDMIAGLIDAENTLAPLADKQIVDLMKAKGVKLARRTVAKYREELGIASSKERISYTSKSALRLVKPQNAVAPESAATPEPKHVVYA